MRAALYEPAAALRWRQAGQRVPIKIGCPRYDTTHKVRRLLTARRNITVRGVISPRDG